MPDKKINKIYSEIQHIRPAARHILTIGKGIIKDNYTAVVELVKNSYDAEAKEVTVTFELINSKIAKEDSKFKIIEILPKLTSNEIDRILKLNAKTELLRLLGSKEDFDKIFTLWHDSKDIFRITVEDDGHGMSLKTVLSKWLVPSTDNKAKMPYSKNEKRLMQGKKGIGRYAASILGEDLLMETIDEDTNQKTIVYIDWSEFENDKYQFLDEVPILIETFDNQAGSGTKLQIDSYHVWTVDDKIDNMGEINELEHELKKLLSPIELSQDNFSIKLIFKNFNYKRQNEIEIKPYPLLEFYHYRIEGVIYKNESHNEIWADFYYKNAYLENSEKEHIKKEIKLKYPKEEYCGKIQFDIRVFDLDQEGFENLSIHNQSLKEPEIRQLLNVSAGVGVFRENFRVRPYGDKKFDWLELAQRRINSPTLRLFNNQITGVVYIENEDNSGLEEKATREGLKETPQYEGLKSSIISVISELEGRRYEYRRATKKGGREQAKPDEQLKKIVDLDSLVDSIQNQLSRAGVEHTVINEIINTVKKTEEEKTKYASLLTVTLEKQFEIIKETIAVYQVQATLGKIINVLLHEGRKPLAYLKEQPVNIIYDTKKLRKEYENKVQISDDLIKALIEKIIDRVEKVKEQSDIFIKLFSKLDSLAITKRPARRQFDLIKTLKQSFEIFEGELSNNNINVEFNCPNKLMFRGWDTDFIAIFTNLIENSIYWLNQTNRREKEIKVIVTIEESDKVLIDFLDNGIGIEEKNIINFIIFEPGFSTKPNGTGLGLAIAGEAVQRNDGHLQAIYQPNGAHFRIELNTTL